LYLLAGREIEPPATADFLPGLALVAFAAVGGSVTRFQRVPDRRASPEPKEDRDRTALFARRFAFAALAFTGLTLLLAWIFAGQQSGSCDVPNNPPAWTIPLGWLAVIAACAAGLCALLGLAGRRWFVALLCFVVNPAALIFMVLSTGAVC